MKGVKMKNLVKSFLIAGAVVLSTSGITVANGLNEDRAWQFEDSNTKFYKLQVERERMFQEGGGYVTNIDTYNNTTNIEQQNNSTNCNNCSTVVIDGDGNVVGVTQYSEGTDQSNEGFQVEVGDTLNINTGP